MMIPYNLIYNFILTRCINYNIDESHAIKHSMDVLRYSQQILLSESIKLGVIILSKSNLTGSSVVCSIIILSPLLFKLLS